MQFDFKLVMNNFGYILYWVINIQWIFMMNFHFVNYKPDFLHKFPCCKFKPDFFFMNVHVVNYKNEFF